MAVIDVCTWNGEADLFELRYNILKDYVDEFIVVEFDKTFSGKNKDYLFHQNNIYNYPKVTYCPIPEKKWLKYESLAWQSPNTLGAEHWKTEFMQKESVKDCLTHLKDNDTVFIGDCDEIWNPEMARSDTRGVIKLKLRVYAYWLNNLSNEVFWGTIKGKYKNIRDECLNHLRSTDYYRATEPECGWHFTSLKDGLKQKLLDSYTAESYATPQVLDNLLDNINNNRDFLGRDFTYIIDESQWPQYLKDNKEKYKHLIKQE